MQRVFRSPKEQKHSVSPVRANSFIEGDCVARMIEGCFTSTPPNARMAQRQLWAIETMCIPKPLRDMWHEWSHVRGHWQELGGFFKLSALRFFVSWFAIVPVITNAFSELPEKVEVTLGGKSYSVLLSLPFHWQLLWVSSLLFAVAYLVYMWRCPSFIKKNQDFSAYDARGHSPRWIVWEIYYTWRSTEEKEKMANRLIEKEYAKPVDRPATTIGSEPTVQKHGTIWHFEKSGKIYEIRLNETTKKEVVADLFWEVFGRWSGSRRYGRNLVWGLLFGSITLFLIVVLQNIWVGVRYLIGF